MRHRPSAQPPIRPSKTERWLNLLAFLLDRHYPASREEILSQVSDYEEDWVDGDAKVRESVRRKFERDKKELKELGVVLEPLKEKVFANHSDQEVEAYQLKPRDFYLPYLGKGWLDRIALRRLPPGASEELAVDLNSRRMKCIAFLFFALTLASAGQALSAQQLEIRFLDVGQGDAALVRSGNKTMLIDAGGSAGVVSYLRAFRIDTIDLVIASHNHADHIGGMTGVLHSTVVRFYLDNGLPHTTATYQRTIQAVQTSGAQYLRATTRTITLGDMQVRILAPPTGGSDQNNSSVGVLVDYGEFHALFTGDSELNELAYWLGNGSIPNVHVVKVAHHGSHNGTSTAWIEATHPQMAVISVGAGNSYGHPSPDVIAEWEAAGTQVYRTDRDGSVLVLANDDGSFVVTKARADTVGVVQLRPFLQDTVVAQPAISPACCRVCTRGEACGNSCINAAYQCHQPPGCACNAKP